MKARAALIVLLLINSGAAHADPLKIRIGWIVAPDSWAPMLFANKAQLRHYGTSYLVEPIHYQSTPLEVTAMATGDLDIGALTFASYAIAIRNARMDDLRVIADEMQDGVPGYFTNQVTVLKAGPIHTVEDLKGRVLGVNASGSAGDMTLRVMLARHHIEMRDVTVIETALPNMNPMLEGHKIDAASSVLPWAIEPDFQAQSRILFTQLDAFGRTQFSFWAARTGYIAGHHAALLDMMEDAIRSAHWLLDPANHAAALAIIASVIKEPEGNFNWAYSKTDYYHDPDLRPDLVALQSNVNTQRDLGFVKGDVDVAKHADLSLIEDARTRLH